ncbi:hypothetical protein QEN19_000717 [Hanseniaspora menglaensis]
MITMGEKHKYETCSTINHKGEDKIDVKKQKIFESIKNVKKNAELKTGYCYDIKMRYHSKIYQSYYEYIDPHPEDPRRISRIYNKIKENDLLKDMAAIDIRTATNDEILKIHTNELLNKIMSLEQKTPKELKELTNQSDSIYFNLESFKSAKLAAGGAIEACKAVVDNKVSNSFAIIRPPGHHAEPDKPSGFCLFSNAAISARYILDNYPNKVKKIVILDWDIHHGNGTHLAFEDNPNVLYISLHRFEMNKFYPGTKLGDIDQVGKDAGEGYCCNVTWPVGGINDVEYMYAFRKIVMPICEEFDPDFVIISSGFDAADGDVIGQCHVSPQCYGQMTHMMKSLANGNLTVLLEGGYNLNSISNSALEVTKVLMGEPPKPFINKKVSTGEVILPKPEVLKNLQRIIELQSKYWKCLRNDSHTIGTDDIGFIDLNIGYKKKFDAAEDSDFDSDDEAVQSTKLINPLTEILQKQRYNSLKQQYNMDNFPYLGIPVYKELAEYISQPLLVLGNVVEAKKCIVLVHEVPKIYLPLDSTNTTNHIDLINLKSSQVVDPSLKMIAWAKKHNYALIDVSLPFIENAPLSLAVMTSLWDDYLSSFPNLNKFSWISLGYPAYQQTSQMVSNLATPEFRNKCSSLISFINHDSMTLNNLKSIHQNFSSNSSINLVDWHYSNSLLLVGKSHQIFQPAVAVNANATLNNGSTVPAGTVSFGHTDTPHNAIKICTPDLGTDLIVSEQDNSTIINGNQIQLKRISQENQFYINGVSTFEKGDPTCSIVNTSTINENGNVAQPKLRKKYGRIIKCDCSGYGIAGLWELMEERWDECADFVLDSFDD